MSHLLTRVAAKGWELRRRTRNRGFTPSLRHAAGAPAVLLSPHLDDAVIDCWSELTAPAPLQVVNIFDAAPPSGTLAFWDRLAGAEDSAALMAERVAEDRAALALAGRRPAGGGLRADPYRSAREAPTLATLDAAIAAACGGAASRLLAPAALGTPHPDHLLVREYALAAVHAGLPVELYADVPYATAYGWPGWVTGDAADPRLDVDAYWRASRADLPDLLVRERARVVALAAPARRAKLAAMRAYRTQFPMLDRGPIGQLTNERVHGFEVFWPAGR